MTLYEEAAEACQGYDFRKGVDMYYLKLRTELKTQSASRGLEGTPILAVIQTIADTIYLELTKQEKAQ